MGVEFGVQRRSSLTPGRPHLLFSRDMHVAGGADCLGALDFDQYHSFYRVLRALLAEHPPGGVAKDVIVTVLDQVAFSQDSALQPFAMQVMEEWWIPRALYRPRGPTDDAPYRPE